MGVHIDAVPMYQPGSGSAHPLGWGNGYVLTIGGKRIYISGDSGDTPEMRAIPNLDVAFAVRGAGGFGRGGRWEARQPQRSRVPHGAGSGIRVHLNDTSSPSPSRMTLTLPRKCAGSRTYARYSESRSAQFTLLCARTRLPAGMRSSPARRMSR